MALHYLSAVISFVVAFLLVWLFKVTAVKRGIFYTEIRSRDVHKDPTPRVGGMAIVMTFLLVASAVYLINPGWFAFVGSTLWGVDKNFLGLILAIVILSVVNIADDYKNISWPWKLATQIVAAAVIAGFGLQVDWLTALGWQFALTGGIAWAFVIIWLVSLANVVNWLDSIDGLAGGVSLIALVVLFLVLVARTQEASSALLAAIAVGSVAGFLPHNFMTKKAFLGDTGAVFLGFIIGFLAIISGGKVTIVFLVMAIPILDAAVVFGSRILNKQSPFLPDQRHLPHRLLAMGLKVWQVDLLYYSMSLFFGLVALNTQLTGRYYAIILAMAVMAILVLLYSRQTTMPTSQQ